MEKLKKAKTQIGQKEKRKKRREKEKCPIALLEEKKCREIKKEKELNTKKGKVIGEIENDNTNKEKEKRENGKCPIVQQEEKEYIEVKTNKEVDTKRKER